MPGTGASSWGWVTAFHKAGCRRRESISVGQKIGTGWVKSRTYQGAAVGPWLRLTVRHSRPNRLRHQVVSALKSGHFGTPRGVGVPPFRFCPSLVHLLPHLLLFLHFYFSFSYLLYLFPLLSILSLSTRIVPLHFQAGSRRRRPNLGLVCFVYYCVTCIA